jgi:hypothetical protein
VGGNILASKKTSYADILNAENLAEVVRELMEEQHKEMLRNLINGVYDSFESSATRHYQPGQLAPESEQGQVKAQPVAPVVKPVVPPAAAQMPPEVAAALAMKVKPKINEVGVETLFGEDLISEKSLDEVILSYLAGEGEQ